MPPSGGATSYAQLVLFAKQRLGASDPQVGFLYAAGSLGVVALSLAAGRLRRRLPFGLVALGVLVLDGVLLVAMRLIRWYWLGLALWAAVSGLGILFNINTASLRQQVTPNQLLGRVLSVATLLGSAVTPLGTVLGGWAVQHTGDVALVYRVVGVTVAAVVLAFWFSPIGHAEHYLAAEPASPAERTAQ